ncbi:MAG: hypothetical protein R3311_15705, partial [Oceanisphaera sp.]|nr:hypothetical protein [Oceanisphaera sp.]
GGLAAQQRAAVLAAALGEALARAEQQLDAGASDQATARELISLADTFSSQAGGRDGVTRQRMLALADTLEGIAEQLR